MLMKLMTPWPESCKTKGEPAKRRTQGPLVERRGHDKCNDDQNKNGTATEGAGKIKQDNYCLYP